MENLKGDEFKTIIDLHEKAQAEPVKTPNTEKMIQANDNALEEAKKSEFSHYAFKRDIYNKADDLFGKSSAGFVQEIDHCLGYSVMKGKLEKPMTDADGNYLRSVAESKLQTSEDVTNLNVHENITKEQVKEGVLKLLDITILNGGSTHSISDYDADKIEAFRSFVKDLK